MNFALITASAFLFIISLFSLFSALKFRKRAEAAAAGAARAADGDWSSISGSAAAATVSATRRIADEGRKTAGALSNRLERLLAAMSNVRGNSETLASESRRTAAEIQSIASAFEEISANTGSLADLISRQAAAVDQSSAAAAQMSASAERMADIVEARKKANARLADTARTGALTARNGGEVIATFAERAGRMTDMIGVIDDIATSTNLLAMNAAIEAAHAGQHGKGFAVVADEIRKLAANTSENAKEISDLLIDLSESIDSARTAGTQSSESFTQIESIVTETVSSFEEMAAGIRELAVGAKDVSDSTTTLRDITGQIETGAREIADATASINRGLRGASDSSGRGAEEMKSMEKNLIDLNLGLLGVSDMNASGGTGSDKIIGELAKLRTADGTDSLKPGALDFATVRLRHKEWVSKIRLNFAGALDLNPAEAASPKKCMLGKWLYEAGGKDKIDRSPHGKELEAVHDSIHALVARILSEKKDLSPEALESAIAELESKSGNLISILGLLEAELSQKAGSVS